MSLFPAYSSKNSDATESNQCATNSAATSEWLENNSFAIDASHLVSTSTRTHQKNECSDDSEDTDTSSKSDSVATHSSDETIGGIKKSRKKSYKKKRKCHENIEAKRQEGSIPAPSPLLDFTGNEEFYVDKNKAKQYCTVRTLHKPACPRYRVHHRALGLLRYSSGKHKLKRYYRYKCSDDEDSSETRCYPLTENEYTAQMGDLNRKTIENCREIQNWLDLINLQDRNPYKWSRLRIAEKKLDYVEKALNFHPYHPDLYAAYIRIITQCYTSHDVSKMLDALLVKDPYSLSLWQAQIMCTQGTMARCMVPDVLQIYERCMKKMFHNQKTSGSHSTQVADSDSIMMLLFHNCSMFLRQSGLYEQFFALIKLAIELNVPVNTQLLDGLQPRAQDEQTLIEYEELILQSGLPMNEIWLRIEKLRQAFFFLPFPGENNKCSDPQRIVFNEDVCHYVYPLQKRETSFKLLLIIAKLLKLPFIQTDCLGKQFEGDTDAIEDLLGIYTNPNYNWSQDHWDFFESLYELGKEMANSPTYMNHNIAHDIYSECVQKYLINCSQAYELIDDRKRLVFLILWSRFQLLLLILEKLNKKLNPDFVKKGRQRFKSLLKQRNNRTCLPLYVEFARYEHEAGSSLETVENIFKNLIDAYNQEENLSSELAYVYLTYAEILLKIGDRERVCVLISAYVLGCTEANVTNSRKLTALNTLKEKVDRTIKIEENVEIMLLEQYLLPDHTLAQVKMYCLLLYTLQQKQTALEFMKKLLLIFNSKQNPRHQFLREQFYEIYVCLLQLPGGNSYVSHSWIQQTIQKALVDYPDNMFLLQKWGCQTSLPWYKLRSGYITANTSIKSVIYLITLARCRFLHSLSGDTKTILPYHQLTATDLHYHETIVRQRILNVFKMLVRMDSSSSSAQHLLTSLQRNSLFWRCFLRCLSDQSCSFELSKHCLLTALDACPWSKALYLDGATYVPQELSHLQDLIIEKQLRIYALPEELEILRER